MKVVRVENPTSILHYDLPVALDLFGTDELLEHLQGYHPNAVFFLIDDGEAVYPVTVEDLR